MFFLPLAFLFSKSLKRKHDLQLELNKEEMIGPFPPKTKQKNLTTLYLATPFPKEENLSHLGACWLMSLVVGDKICGSKLCYILISWGCVPSSMFLKFYNEPSDWPIIKKFSNFGNSPIYKYSSQHALAILPNYNEK
jgi:hypothetical protein